MDLAMIQRTHFSLNTSLHPLKSALKTLSKQQPLRLLFSKNSLAVLAIAALAGCANKPGISTAVSWDALEGWNNDQLSQSIPPLLAQCPKLEKKSTKWNKICQRASTLDISNEKRVNQFYKRYFQPHKIIGNNHQNTGLITGYYEPLLKGSYTKSKRYNYPIYQKPKDLMRVDAAHNLLKVKDNKARGRMVNGKIRAYYSRAQIDSNKQPLKGNELLWVDSSDDAFFLHIQGSGLVELEDGSIIGVAYADQNGHPYRAIGRDLINMGAIEKEDISLQTIKAWLTENPQQAGALKNKNPSYIFFSLRSDVELGPRGSLNVPLTPERSVAVDRRIVPLGSPLWLNTTLPNSDQTYQRLVFAQDTGGAINGPIRADVFFGRGERAKQLAGEMKQEGKIFILMPK